MTIIYFIGIFFLFAVVLITYLYNIVKQKTLGKFDVRSITLDYEQLVNHASEIAKMHDSFKKRGDTNYLFKRISENYKYITNTYIDLMGLFKDGEKCSGVDEWLLDNFYVIEEQTKEVRKNIRSSNFKRLPIISQGQYSGFPRIFAIAMELVSHTDGIITEDYIVDFINEYQKISHLTDNEIWSLAPMLKIALLENIKHLCQYINSTNNQYKEAKVIIDKIFNKNCKYTDALSEYFKKSFSDNITLIHFLLTELRKLGKDGSNGIKYIDLRLSKLNTNSENIINIEHQKQAAKQVSLGNCITTLRFIMSINYVDVFEKLSQLELILSKDPSGIYKQMSRKSKQLYRQNLQRIAHLYDLSEVEVANNAIELANNGDSDKTRHVGYYLIDTNLGNKNNNKLKQSYYFVFIAVATFVISYVLSYESYVLSGNMLLSLLVFALSLIPSSDIAINFINYLTTRSIKVALIPRLKFTDGIPNDKATLVVIAALLPNAKQAESLITRLETYYLSNKEENIYFGILSDFTDSKEQTNSSDNEIINIALKRINELNKKYNNEFLLFQRKRVYNKFDNNYMGWERKRGAIVELTRLLRGEKNTSFEHIIGQLPKIKYIITLDADTTLPRDFAKELIGAMAHPLNKPLVQNGKVVEGYGIMQPRILIDIESANTSYFSRIFAGIGGVDAYTGAVSDVYQDLFSEGSFTGKGIFDVDVFYDLMPNAIPENKVLSHDLLEGCYLRCGLISDVYFVDGFPFKYNSYMARQHRWTRGDWQLLPFLFNTIKNPLNKVSKWKIFDNMRRSLVPIFIIAILLLAFNILPESSFIWTAFAVITLFFSLLITTIDWTINYGYKSVGEKFHSPIIYGLKGMFYQAFLMLMFLPYSAYMEANAILITLYRLLFSHKKMLEWVTSADVESKLSFDIKSFYFRMLPCVLASAIILFFSTKYLLLSLFFAIIWAIAPYIAYVVSKKIEQKPLKMNAEEKDQLYDLAYRIWCYFKDYVVPGTNYLAPDNFQENPPNGAAKRTSPTNIGMQLMAFLCAKDFGFIDELQMLSYIKKTLDTIDKMEKWNGHLYNWYDTVKLHPLYPRYVSTVDSGNLVGYLITLKQALLSYENDAGLLIDRIKKLINETDFSVLFSSKRNLFSIGYNIEEGHLTKSFYDLLASECRQTSYIAIAKGDVSKKHWFNLGRSLVYRDGYKGLVSWTGTMFEYLMPLLVMRNINNTLLDETYNFVIRAQKKYGKRRNVPWGTSESGFNAFDINLNYQYKAFGVPDLGLKRGLISDMVVAPYATIMALMVDFDGAMNNIKQLKKQNIYGKYGFYESIDYTPKRVLPNEKYSVVRSYMVHHLGMSIMALDNVLNDNILQKRFHSDIKIKATEELLSERVPTNVIISKENKEKVTPFKENTHVIERYYSETPKIDVNNPTMYLMSNGRYCVAVSDGGVGYSKCNNINLTRFRNDLQNGIYGNFVFINNITDGYWWSNTLAPAFYESENYSTIFTDGKAEFFRKGTNGVDTTTEVIVSPEDDAEIRRITITNNSDKDVILEITTYCEVVLNKPENDMAHPAFSNLFIQTEFDKQNDIIIANRRPKEHNADTLYGVHAVSFCDKIIGSVEYETDRSKVIGRNRTIISPSAIVNRIEVSNSDGAVLDPIMSLKFKIKVERGLSTNFSFIYGFSQNRDDAVAMARKLKSQSAIEHCFEMSYTRSQIVNKYLGISMLQEKNAYDLLSNIIYILPYRLKLHDFISNNKLGQKSLWTFGISGDIPIITLKVYNADQLCMVENLLVMHEFWKIKGFNVDLVIISEDEHSYNQALIASIRDIIAVSHIRKSVGVSGGVFILDGAVIESPIKNLIFAASKIVLGSDNYDISHQINVEDNNKLLPFIKFNGKEYAKKNLTLPQLDFFNGHGGFTENEYVIILSEKNTTPLPWINIIANENFGFTISESGGGYIWANNSRENKITPWTNDFVSDTCHESIYIRDDENGKVWNTTPSPVRTDSDYLIRHGFGYSSFETINQDIQTKHTMFVPTDKNVKVGIIEFTNSSKKDRELTVTYYINPILTSFEHYSKPFMKIGKDGNSITAENNHNTDYELNKVFASCSVDITSYTADKREFFGESRGNKVPQGLLREGFSNSIGCGYDSCIAIQCKVNLHKGESKKIVVTLGHNKAYNEILSYDKAYAELENVKDYWRDITSVIQVETPSKSMDIMLNGWLVYQNLSCRIFARSAFYQSGGAYGFRDQLQDVGAMLLIDPDFAKNQIIRSSYHQFIEGDVQHWWHELDSKLEFEVDKGIRTRFSDDLLWLPYIVAQYISVTEDYNLLDVVTPFIEDEPLNDDEDERYSIPRLSKEEGSIYKHCIFAIEHSLKFGEHGLPLMGSGDWNDGMSTVGNKGKGESVWLGWFLFNILKVYVPICKSRNDNELAIKYNNIADELRKSLNENAWDGAWYRRAYTDDGHVIGSNENTECKIDAIAQAWSVISGGGDIEHQNEAMQSVLKYLVNKDEGIIKLLSPPFDNGDINPGYIKGYVPGVRENGGQYTHAATWVIYAFAKLGFADIATELFYMINPINHSRTAIEVSKYKTEPYSLAADVYTVSPNVGRGGWTWYTGAAGWFYRVGIESILGIKKQGEKLVISPCIPKSWENCKVNYKYKSTIYNISISSTDKTVTVDLVDDGKKHDIYIN